MIKTFSDHLILGSALHRYWLILILQQTYVEAIIPILQVWKMKAQKIKENILLWNQVFYARPSSLDGVPFCEYIEGQGFP